MNHAINLSLVDSLDAVLPQTQCTQCGFSGCKPYAEAIASGAADINQCPPGGDAGVAKLATLLGVAVKPLNAEHGSYKPRAVALIDEAHCIGCTLCIQACPVDAIVGAAKLMHTVLTEDCTGCELCLPPCPVDCISMEATDTRSANHVQAAADLARQRHQAWLLRREGTAVSPTDCANVADATISPAQSKAAKIRAAMEKAAALRAS